MKLTEMLQNAGFKAEKVKEQAFILQGVYKCVFVKAEFVEDKGYGESLYGQFKISEVLKGQESKSQFPEFKQYFKLTAEDIANKKIGLAKLINGLFSVKVEIDGSSDEKLKESINDALGAEVYINSFKKKKFKKEDNGNFTEVAGEFKQEWTFLTLESALKKAKSTETKAVSSSSSL